MGRILERSVGTFVEAKFDMIQSIEDRLKEFMESEGKSCSFDPELITPEYVYRMWGGRVSIEEIANAMSEVRRMMSDNARQLVFSEY